ncbi:MAG: hypothetical protein CM15mP74_21950 [Halieaceae bacterium]|nr:MAG: hypothetical protein CM15mP74_21950 [Halieaceae bacterium]
MQFVRGGKLTDANNLSKAQRIAYIDERLQALYPETPCTLIIVTPIPCSSRFYSAHNVLTNG